MTRRYHVEFEHDTDAARFVNWVTSAMPTPSTARQSTGIPRLVEFDQQAFDFLANQLPTKPFCLDAYGSLSGPRAGRLWVDRMDVYYVTTPTVRTVADTGYHEEQT